jgi:37-kD nucleoid-associated bacterial protein
MAIIDTADVTVTDAILHLLDPDVGGFAPSHRALPTPSGAVGRFLAGHVAHGLSDSQTKGARFVGFGTETAPGILQRLVVGHNFVADSQALAESAYKLMEGDKRIKPPGSLAVVRYEIAATRGVCQVAAMKLDKGGRFRWLMREDESGAAYWDLQETADVAPSTEERLHKAAFVGPIPATELTGLGTTGETPKAAGTHQFLVLDRQVKEGADWWLTKFLVAAPAFTQDERAEKWIKGALAGKCRVQRRLTDNQRGGLDLAIRSAMASSNVNVNEWMQSLSMPDDLKNELRAEIDTRLPDNEFAISDSVRKKYAKRSWVGDNGLRVTIDALYADQLKERQADHGWEITIRTTRWDPVS